jgi:hypothetical protein
MFDNILCVVLMCFYMCTGAFDSIICSTTEMGGEGDGSKTTSEAVDEAATNAINMAQLHPDAREAPPYHSFGKHIRSIWRMLKQGGVYFLISTAPPESRTQKIKRVGHGLKTSMEMWQKAVHVRIDKMGSKLLNTLSPDEKYHWCYIFVKTARRDVLKIGSAPVVVIAPVASVELGLDPKEESSSDDSSDGDLIDSNDESEEEEEIVSDVEESVVSEES